MLDAASQIPGKDRTDTYDTLLLDLGDVMFQWSADTKTAISPKVLRSMLESSTWREYESGRLSESECYADLSKEFDIPLPFVEQTFNAARNTLYADQRMVNLVASLRKAHPGLKVFAMSNMSAPDFVVAHSCLADWSIFDRIYISASVGIRKPELGFYKIVIRETGLDPRRTIFVDDKAENVASAKSFGMEGIIHSSFEKTAQRLKNLLGDPVHRGRAYLLNHAKKLQSYTNTNVTLHENFTQMLILEATRAPNLIDYVKFPRQINFFQGKGQLTSADYPADMDTTAVTYSVLPQADCTLVNSVMDEMLSYRNSDGIIQVYFDSRRPRIDPVVCTNVLYLFYLNDRGHDLPETLDWVYSVLLHRAYLDGTRFYTTAECFLFFLDRLISLPAFSDPKGRPWHHLLAERVSELRGTPADGLALAMRIIVLTSCSIYPAPEYKRLVEMQAADGNWEGWVYRYGKTGVLIGNRGLATALGIDAVLRVRGMERRPLVA